MIKYQPATYVYGSLNSEEKTEPSLVPSPLLPPPLPGECVCNGSSGQAGSCSAFHTLQIFFLDHRKVKTMKTARCQVKTSVYDTGLS